MTNFDTGSCLLGIDAGGTSLRIALADSATGIVRASVRGPSASDGGPEPVGTLLKELLDDTETIPVENIASVCAGITKISRAGVRETWERSLRDLMPTARLSVVPDYVTAFHGGVPGGTGIMIVAGTGSVAYGENSAGDAVRVGGRGWEYGDEGSGAWLTTEAVRRTLHALDGLDQPTPLTQAICGFLGSEEPAALGEAARQRAAEEGRGYLVPLLLEYARDRDDTEAKNLFVGAGGWLSAYVRATAERLGFTAEDIFPVALVGGLWETGGLVRIPFETVLHRRFSNATIAPAADPPVIGAVRLASRLLNC